ncbi:MAG: PIN domain-containing protein [Labilithrix sp.]|nr:PIN domain-containing protein [Labilithrix sp.]MCW5812195.1 PIN domain-containing protein [Labilithrix sp.]
MRTITFDTGALIGLERKNARIVAIGRVAKKRGDLIIVPAAVLAEWWRGRSDVRDMILGLVDVEPLDAELAKVAGEAIAAVKGATVVDAIVMASAARSGSAVYTSDLDDLQRLQAFFPDTRIFKV